jgi:hypothetical protein
VRASLNALPSAYHVRHYRPPTTCSLIRVRYEYRSDCKERSGGCVYLNPTRWAPSQKFHGNREDNSQGSDDPSTRVPRPNGFQGEDRTCQKKGDEDACEDIHHFDQSVIADVWRVAFFLIARTSGLGSPGTGKIPAKILENMILNPGNCCEDPLREEVLRGRHSP